MANTTPDRIVSSGRHSPARGPDQLPAGASAGPAIQDADRLSDDELDAYVLARLRNVGVDLSVLPEDDEDAPADQQRILASARRFLRGSVRTISNLSLTPDAALPGSIPLDPYPPGMYPSALSTWTEEP
ncbi:MAG: hypothetical protein OEO23_04585 [Gemmatimonadota bacterium]|nr:hypothetical protein [Gemmatimonadota bacterium]